MQSIAQTVCRHSPADEDDYAKKEMTSATRTSGRLAFATALPMRMTQSRSTPSMVATRTGPGVGGMKAWPTARPFSKTSLSS